MSSVDYTVASDGGDPSLAELYLALRGRLKTMILLPLAVGLMSLPVTFLMPKTYTARTSFIPPQKPQSAANNALASLGPLASLAGMSAGARNQAAEQYVALLESLTVSDRIIDQFELMQVYDEKLRVEAREELEDNVRISLGKKDGLISVEVDDRDPQRAANMANQYVEELRRMASTLALTEAQQRRVFFEQMLKQSRDALAQAQQALQASGFTSAALKAEPKAAAEGYASLQAQVTSAEVRLQALRGSMTDAAPEVRQQVAALGALRTQLDRLEASAATGPGPDYVGRYREFKYQETLFELHARQFELARIDESRENALIQVVDTALPPERKSWPRHGLTAVVVTVATFILLVIGLLIRSNLERTLRPAARVQA